MIKGGIKLKRFRYRYLVQYEGKKIKGSFFMVLGYPIRTQRQVLKVQNYIKNSLSKEYEISTLGIVNISPLFR